MRTGRDRSCARSAPSSSPRPHACPHAGCPRTASCSCRWPVPVHSAHVGQEVEVFYRWHALYGRRLRRLYSECRATGELVHVEVGDGVVVTVAGWMLDAAACSAFTLGPPRASVKALAELHRLLVEHGCRRSLPGVHHTVGEASHEDEFESSSSASQVSPGGQPASALHDVRDAGAPGSDARAASDGDASARRRAVAGRRP